ncbi:4-hydroxybenzoate polyprenyltransferase [Olivibacter domesticus]|uniref:4-hydroxybenzoate polyprenyltransferase n=2 Tax=Olivibacter domesticus TaxID=407022 RepID=A0A1H7XYN6_OLID1|nr:4-hydroxybenzoate polyprenyltransferase [Olivibacter domesticus]
MRLLRPANIITSITDVLAGISLSGIFFIDHSTVALDTIVLLCVSTIGLYGGGIVFNDVFDAALDKIERPERPIPSGIIPIQRAFILGTVFFVMGVIAAFLVNFTAGYLAVFIVLTALLYNKWGKHHAMLGPPNMGLCRGLNLLLGVSILPNQVIAMWYVALVPILYIGAITLISRGEVSGSTKKPLLVAAVLYAIVIAAIGSLANHNQHFFLTVTTLLIFAWMVYRPLWKAIKNSSGKNIREAVRAGILSLIVMNAGWALASGVFLLAAIMLLMLPLSRWLGRFFAVT